MRGRKGVIYKDITQSGQFFCEVTVVFLFFLIVTDVLQQEDFSGRKSGDAGYNDAEGSLSGTQPIGRLKPNKFGLHDMSGNLLQWCGGWYDAGQTRRFLRGSHWASYQKPDLFLSARRSLAPGMTTEKNLGDSFRCVLELTKP